MMKLITVLLFVAVASAGTMYTHGITGAFNAVGQVNWQGWGYWSKTTKRWQPLNPPVFNNGFSPARSQIVGTSDGGAIVVGSFTSVNGRTAAGVATYDPSTDMWYPANEVGLYNVPTFSVGGPGIRCLATKSEGVAYISASARTKAPFVWSTSTDQLQNNARYPIQVPVATDMLTGQSRILNAALPYPQMQSAFHSPGEGRAIMADSAVPDTFYVFGNFYHVGVDVEAPHNSGLSAAGMVQFTYNPADKLITAAPLRGRGYDARQVGSTQDQLHPRHCGHVGGAGCVGQSLDPNACASVTPHQGAGPVQAGFTKDGQNLHFFVQEGGDVMRWTTDTDRWVTINVNDGSAGRAGTGVVLGPLCGVGFQPGCNYNLRTGGGNAFSWAITPNHDQVWLFNSIYPNTDDFGASSPQQDEGSCTNWSPNGWDIPAVPETLRLFGGAKSTDLAGLAWASAFTTDQLPVDIFRAKTRVPPNLPTRTSSCINTLRAYPTAKDSVIFYSDERFPGTAAGSFQANVLTHSRFLGIHEVTGTAAAVPIDGGGLPRWSIPSNVNNNLDDNGNPELAWSSNNNLAAFQAIQKQSNGDIYLAATSEILFDPLLPGAGDTGHFPDSSGGLYWKKTFGGGYALRKADGTWERPFGGGLTAFPTTSWERTVDSDERVYFLTQPGVGAFNFAAQSGIAVYDANSYSWVDPMADWRLISLTPNFYASPAGRNQMGADGAATLIHFQGEEFIIGGRFSFVGDAHFGSIFVWDGKTPGAGYRAVGSASTGLYKQTIGLTPNKQWNEKLAPSTTNRRVAEGTVFSLTNDLNRLFVSGDFDRSTNEITSTNWISNVATISDYTDTTATWQSVDNGCSQQPTQLVIYKDYLYAGGGFTWCGGPHRTTPTTGIARIKKDLADTDVPEPRRWEALGLGLQLGLGSGVQAMVVIDNAAIGNALVVGGSFTSVDASGFSNFAMWTGTEWITTMPNVCNQDCDNNPLGVLMSKGTAGWLGARPAGTVESLIVTDRIWAVIAIPSAASTGLTAAREIVYYTGTAWYRPTNGALVASADNVNGMLAVNGTTNAVMLANAALPKNTLPALGGHTANYVHLTAGKVGEVHRFQNYPGHHGTDGAIFHFAGAGATTVSIVVLLAVLFAAL